MKQKSIQMTIALSIFATILCGVTAVNRHWDESWKLFWYDLKNGFSGFGWLYTTALATVFLLAAAVAGILY